MKFKFEHTNINVLDIEKSVDFYTKALGMKETRRNTASDGSFTIVFMATGDGANLLELTCLADRETPYDLGDNESHLAFVTDDIEAAHALHEEMKCVCYENTAMGLYFICDPDDYWIEILKR